MMLRASGVLSTLGGSRLAASTLLLALVGFVGCAITPQIFPEEISAQVDRSVDFLVLKDMPESYAGRVVELTGQIVDAVQSDDGIIITVQEPGAILVEEDEEWTQMAFPGSTPVVPRLKKIDLPTRGMFLLHHEGETDAALFPKGAIIKAIGTVRGAKPLFHDVRGVPYRHVLHVSASCTHIWEWNGQHDSPKTEALVCQPVG